MFIASTSAVAANSAPKPTPTGLSGGRDLYLEVLVDGAPASRIVAFKERPDGRLAMAREGLSLLGRAGEMAVADKEGFVAIDGLGGITYRFDEAAQQIHFTTTAAREIPNIYEARRQGAAADISPSEPSPGAIINYTLFATSNADLDSWLSDFDRGGVASAALEARLFGPLGLFSQSALANTDFLGNGRAVRLDSTWSHSDLETLKTWRAGDFISGGLAWTRPVRLGGFQVQRNFGLRPDLITMPIPELSGSASVPSTVEVYANNVRLFRQDVPAGTFVISNLPMPSGAGNARVIIRDSLGRESVKEKPFYASSSLLRSGLLDFSLEAGAPRLSFGVESNDYQRLFAGSVSARYGWSDQLTLEGHAEIAPGLINAGAGAVFPVGHMGVASLAGSASRSDDVGAQIAASLEMSVASLNLYARTQRTFGDYEDIASLSARKADDTFNTDPDKFRPPKAIDQIGISFPFKFDPSRIAVNYTQFEDYEESVTRVVSATYTRPIYGSASFYATGFQTLEGEGSFGIFAGITMSLGDNKSLTASVSGGPDGAVAGLDVVKSETQEIGSYGWRVRDREGDKPDRFASLSYRAERARFQVSAQQYGDDLRATGEVSGAVAILGDEIFLTNRVADAFAVVDVHAPDVEVRYENRPVGVTGESGRIIVPDLRAYEANRISIDPKHLPVDADIPVTKQIVVPAGHAGIFVDFGVRTDTRTAVVVFTRSSGQPLPVGSLARLDASGGEFIIGYDGQAYISGLGDLNDVTVELADGGECRAQFPFSPSQDRTVIEGVVCR